MGTWTYSEPALSFESDNVLSSLTSSVASSKIESYLETIVEKTGIADGMTLVFDEDNSFTSTVKSKTISGTWEISDDKLVLTVSKKSVSVDTQMSGSSTLQLLVDGTKLLSLLQTLSSTASSVSSSVSTISTLLSSYDGMQIGLTFTK